MIYLPSCHSTNDIAAELVLKGLADEGTIVITDNQVKGKGQRGAEWYSEPSKNFTFSIILRPSFLSIAEQFLLSQTVALAIYNYVSLYSIEVKIKWPNDIYVSSKKISGTLIENSIQGTSLGHSIVGIGINVNQTEFFNPKSTSLANVLGHQLSLTSEFYKLVSLLDSGYLKLKSMQQADTIRNRYLSNLLGYNQLNSFKYKGELVGGTVTGITDSGKLCLKLNTENSVKEFDLKEIQWVFDV